LEVRQFVHKKPAAHPYPEPDQLISDVRKYNEKNKLGKISRELLYILHVYYFTLASLKHSAKRNSTETKQPERYFQRSSTYITVKLLSAKEGNSGMDSTLKDLSISESV
jgi:hypothetical protein